MKIKFNKEDKIKYLKLLDTKEINMAVASMFMDYNTYIDVVDEKITDSDLKEIINKKLFKIIELLELSINEAK